MVTGEGASRGALVLFIMFSSITLSLVRAIGGATVAAILTFDRMPKTTDKEGKCRNYDEDDDEFLHGLLDEEAYCLEEDGGYEPG